MIVELSVNDFKNEVWEFLMPVRTKKNARGMWIMWAFVAKGPPSLTTGAYRYQEIPLPVFTDWWETE